MLEYNRCIESVCECVCVRARTEYECGMAWACLLWLCSNTAEDDLSTLWTGLELSPSSLHGRASQLLVPVARVHPDSDSICFSYAAYHCEQMPENRQLEGGKIYFASWFWRLEPIMAAGGSMAVGVCSSQQLLTHI